MRNWIDNIPAMSGRQDYQASHFDMVEAAQGAVAVSSEIKTSPLSRDFMVWSVGQPIPKVEPAKVFGFDLGSDDTTVITVFTADEDEFDESVEFFYSLYNANRAAPKSLVLNPIANSIINGDIVSWIGDRGEAHKGKIVAEQTSSAAKIWGIWRDGTSICASIPSPNRRPMSP